MTFSRTHGNTDRLDALLCPSVPKPAGALGSTMLWTASQGLGKRGAKGFIDKIQMCLYTGPYWGQDQATDPTLPGLQLGMALCRPQP